MPTEPSGASGLSRLQRIFVGERGLRAGWRLAIFLVPAIVLTNAAFWLIQRFTGDLTQAPLTARLFVLMEVVYLVVTLAAIALMARIEHRRFADYGVPLRTMFGRPFWSGALWGVAALGAIGLLVALAGGLAVDGVSTGSAVASAALWWALATLLGSLFEEIFFRGYFLSTLADGIGFWPAAVLQSLFFGFVLHYLEKENETLLDGFNVSLIAFAFCASVARTGDVRWATGMHFTFNYASFFVLGSPNTAFGGPVEPHLLRSSFAGPAWLTGGPTGLEASVAATLVFAALFLVIRRLRPRPSDKLAVA